MRTQGRIGISAAFAIVLAIACGGCNNSLDDTIGDISDPAQSGLLITIDGTEVQADGTFDFGLVQMLSYTEVTGTVENTGEADLQLSGSLPLVLSGSGRFSVQAQPDTVIPAGGESPFTVRFLPSETGAVNATLTIESNAPDADRVNITLSGTGSDAEISVFRDVAEVLSGDEIQLGSTQTGEPLAAEFVVTNAGTGTLELQVTPGIDGTGAEMYATSEVAPSELAEGESGSFTVTFTPSDFGSFTAEIELSCNDRDESAFTFSVTGSAVFAGSRTIDTMSYTPTVVSGSALSLVRGPEKLYVAYRHTDTGLKLAQSEDDGNAWELSTIDEDVTNQNVGLNPAYFVDGDTHVVLYADEINANYHRLCYSTSTDGGSSWMLPSYPVDSANCGIRYGACIIADQVQLAFDNFPLSHTAFAWANDNWPVAHSTLDSSARVGEVCLRGYDSNVFIAYEDVDNDHRLLYAYSTNYGASFTSGITIDTAGDPGSGLDMCIADGEVLLSYYDWFDYELRFARSNADGITWPADPVRILDTEVYLRGNTSIACDGSHVYVAYYDGNTDTLRIVTSADGGESWSASSSVRPLYDWDVYSDLVADGDSLYLAFTDYTSNSIEFLKSVDGGATWPE